MVEDEKEVNSRTTMSLSVPVWFHASSNTFNDTLCTPSHTYTDIFIYIYMHTSPTHIHTIHFDIFKEEIGSHANDTVLLV